MLETANEISTLLQETFLAQREIVELDVPGGDVKTFAIQIKGGEIVEAWQLLRSYLSVTQRWPVVVATWDGDGQDWSTAIVDADFLSRWPFQADSAHQAADYFLPGTIVARSYDVDLDAFLAEQAVQQRQLADAHVLKEEIAYEMDNLPGRFDRAPIQAQLMSQVDRGEIQSTLDLETWLLDWEIAQGIGLEPPQEENGYLSWYEPGPGQSLALLLLPTAHSWEALAYVHWYGAEDIGSETVAAFLDLWHEHYGAELVCHYGTMLQLVVQRKPATLQDAFDLAWEQTAIAPCTTLLPGISLRDHARALMGCDRWFLHERP